MLFIKNGFESRFCAMDQYSQILAIYPEIPANVILITFLKKDLSNEFSIFLSQLV